MSPLDSSPDFALKPNIFGVCKIVLELLGRVSHKTCNSRRPGFAAAAAASALLLRNRVAYVKLAAAAARNVCVNCKPRLLKKNDNVRHFVNKK